jgi:hypothetical protein
MLEIQRTQFTRALAILDQLGCQYAVKDPDGGTWGVLLVVEQKRKNKAPRRDMSHLMIPAKVDPMLIGDVVVFESVPMDLLAGVGSNISSRGVSRFGKGNFTIQTVRDSIQCMRLA